MSTALRSLDLDGESVNNFSHNGTVGSNKYRTSSRNSTVHGSKHSIESDEDIDFDDTRLETPHRSTLHNISSRNSLGEASSRTSGHIVRNKTVKVPLNDEEHGSTRKRGRQSPSSARQYNKYRSRNGTPLRYSIGISKQSDSKKDSDDHQDTSIRENKLISDDNRFTPGSLPAMQTSPMKKSKLNSAEANSYSPPSHLKIKPLSSFRLAEQEESTRLNFNNLDTPQKPNDDIEFDSSESGKEVISARKTSVALRNASDAERKLQDEVEGKNAEEISRTDLLERINNTINSIKENEVSPSVSPSPQTRREQTIDVPEGNNLSAEVKRRSPIVSDSDSVSSGSQIDILNELDSHLLNKNNIISSRSVSPANLDKFHPFVESRNPGFTPGRQVKNTSNLNSEVLNGFQDQLWNRSLDIVEGPKYQRKINILEESSNEWSTDNWQKLLRVLNSPVISKVDIINSEFLLKELGCSSRDELRTRVDFLLEFQRVRRIKTKHHSRRKKHASKITK